MGNLFILREVFTNGLDYSVINIISAFSILFAISVIISKNPVVSVLFLIGLFLNIAGYLMLLGMNFIGLSYLLVYVGAVSILFLFILMLINIRVSELITDNNNGIPLAFVIGLFLYVTIYNILPLNNSYYNNSLYNVLNNGLFNYKLESINLSEINLSFVTSQIWDGALMESSHITSIGGIMYSNYSIWLILTSLILLLSMVGAIIITIKQ